MFHALRHTNASALIPASIDVVKVSRPWAMPIRR